MALESSGIITLNVGTVPSYTGGSAAAFGSTQINGKYVSSQGLVGGLNNHVIAKSRQTGLKIESSINRTWQNQAAPINGIIQPVYSSSIRLVFETNDPASTPTVMLAQFAGLSAYMTLNQLTKLMGGQV